MSNKVSNLKLFQASWKAKVHNVKKFVEFEYLIDYVKVIDDVAIYWRLGTQNIQMMIQAMTLHCLHAWLVKLLWLIVLRFITKTYLMLLLILTIMIYLMILFTSVAITRPKCVHDIYDITITDVNSVTSDFELIGPLLV